MSDINKERLARNCRHHREKLGWTQNDLAEKARQNLKTIQRFENAKSKECPNYSTINSIAEAFGLSFGDFTQKEFAPSPLKHEPDWKLKFKNLSEALDATNAAASIYIEKAKAALLHEKTKIEFKKGELIGKLEEEKLRLAFLEPERQEKRKIIFPNGRLVLKSNFIPIEDEKKSEDICRTPKS